MILFISCIFFFVILNLLFQNKELLYKLYKLGVFKGCYNFKILKNFFNIIYLFFLSGIQLLLQKYFYKNIYEIEPNIYEIKCVLKGKMHLLRFKVISGPGKVLQITDKNMNDLTCKVEPYVNGYDLELIYITPNHINCEEIYIEKFDGSNEIFYKNDNILLKNKTN